MPKFCFGIQVGLHGCEMETLQPATLMVVGYIHPLLKPWRPSASCLLLVPDIFIIVTRDFSHILK